MTTNAGMGAYFGVFILVVMTLVIVAGTGALASTFLDPRVGWSIAALVGGAYVWHMRGSWHMMWNYANEALPRDRVADAVAVIGALLIFIGAIVRHGFWGAFIFVVGIVLILGAPFLSTAVGRLQQRFARAEGR